MIFPRFKVFVSSRMEELAAERRRIAKALDDIEVDAWVFERRAGARPESAEQTYRKELERADVYLGVFWKGYGEYTIDEYELAMLHDKDCLIYQKRLADDQERDPRLTDFLDRLGDVERGHTLKWFTSVDELSDFVREDVARLRERSYSEPQITQPNITADDADRGQLRLLLEKVKSHWIDGMLKDASRESVLSLLDLNTEPDAVTHPADIVQEFRNRAPKLVPKGTSLASLLREVGGTLLILGDPGAGKTIMMLQLARSLIKKAEVDPQSPIPVIINIGDWNERQPPLCRWIAEAMNRYYSTSRDQGVDWLKDTRLLLLLDGLDEIAEETRPLCVDAINRFVKESGVPGLVVCCRYDEYDALPNRLKLSGAVNIRKLSNRQIKDFLAQRDEEIEGLKEALVRDQELLAIARTPLMLHVMVVAYQGLTSESISSGYFENSDARRKHLFGAYIDAMFRRKKKVRRQKESTTGILSWLARQMNRHSKPIFLLEEMQPSWLESPAQHLVYAVNSRSLGGLALGLTLGLLYWLLLLIRSSHGSMIPILMGLTVGMLSGIIAGFMDLQSYRRKQSAPLSQSIWTSARYVITYILVLGVVEGMLALAFVSVFDAPVAAVFIGLVFGLYFGLNSTQKRLQLDVRTIERLGWSFHRGVHQAGKWALWGSISGVVTGFLFWMVFKYSDDPISIVIYLFLAGLACAAVGGLCGFAFGGVQKMQAKKTMLNQGIRQTLRNIFFLGGMAGLMVCAVLAFFEGMSAGIAGGTFVGLLVAVWYGGLDVIQHALLRIIFHLNGQFPLRYRRFLEDSRRLALVRRVGGGYMFIHRFLQDYLDEQSEKEELQAASHRFNDAKVP